MLPAHACARVLSHQRRGDTGWWATTATAGTRAVATAACRGGGPRITGTWTSKHDYKGGKGGERRDDDEEENGVMDLERKSVHVLTFARAFEEFP